MKILVVDDSPELAAKWASDIGKALPNGAGHQIEPLEGAHILEDLKTLRSRRASCRVGAPDFTAACRVDEADVLVVDYELWQLDPSQQISGEELSYLARAYSRCGMVIGVNQGAHKDPVFDLTLREDHAELFADVIVNGLLIGAEGLWLPGGWSTFRPWSWPNVANFVEALESNAAYIQAHLDEPLTEACNLEAAQLELLTSRERAFFSPFELDATLTFRQVSQCSVGLRGKEGEYPPPEEFTARLVASRLMCWLARVVCQECEWLVDLPHLASMIPETIKLAMLNGEFHRLCALSPDTLEYVQDDVKEAEWSAALKLDRVVFQRPTAMKIALEKRLRLEDENFRKLVFCEDASGFRQREDASEFLSDLEGSSRWRWVTSPQFPLINYHPKSLLAL